MIRKAARRARSHHRIEALVERHRIPRAYVSTNRRSVARAFAVGLFFALMPMPFQMAAVLALMPFFAFNVPIALALVWVSNPLTMPIIFYAEYLVGNWILMRDGGGEAANAPVSLEWFENNLEAVITPLFSGALVCGILCALGAYLLVNVLWARSVYDERNRKRNS